MYYKVKSGYRLVGWRNLPTGVLDLNKNATSFLSRDEYGLLLHMNGQEEINPDTLTEKQRESLRKFFEHGLIESGDLPFSETEKPFYRFYDNVFVESFHWSITGKCNYNCRHCLVSSPKNREDDFTTQQCLDIIRQIADCGARKVSLTGGEPLVRKDFPLLVQACTDANIEITGILTNGALLTPELLSQIIGMGQHPEIQISYDGVGWHDWVRGRDGAQEIAERAFQAAHEAGLKTYAAMCLFRNNIPAVRETVRRLVSLSVDRIKISPMLAMGLWDERYADRTLSQDEFLQVVLDYIPQFFDDGKPCNFSMGGCMIYQKEKDIFTTSRAKAPDTPCPLYPCSGIVINPYISAKGMILPCMEFAGRPEYEHFPNLKETALADILRDSVWLTTTRTKLKDIFEHNAECRECPERGKHCGQSCRSCTEGDYSGINRDFCDFVKKGGYLRVQEAVEKAGGRFILT